MQKEKRNKPFFKYWKSITYYELKIQKAIESQKKDIGRLIFLFRVNNNNASVLRKIIPYSLSGFFDYIYRICINEHFNKLSSKSNRD